MTSRQRLLAALDRKKVDRLPVTTHHIMPSFLDRVMDGITTQDFFDKFDFDAILWLVHHTADKGRGEYTNPENKKELGFLEAKLVSSDNWRVTSEIIPNDKYKTERFTIHTPKKDLTCVLQSDVHTTWVTEHVLKEKSDIEILQKYMTHPVCDVPKVNSAAEAFGERGIVRTHIPAFDIFGQPGCWQDACCVFGTENMIMEVYEDPAWVHELLLTLQARKLTFIKSLKGAKYDLLELGGGDGCLSVINPSIFNEFVAPYDAKLIEEAKAVGHRVTYHLCGRKMAIIEDVAKMKPCAIETFTPSGMGGDTVLKEAKERIGDKVCMIGGFDQNEFFVNATVEETRAQVRKCFEDAGKGGGYILAPSDHFFDAKPELLQAFVDEAKRCIY